MAGKAVRVARPNACVGQVIGEACWDVERPVHCLRRDVNADFANAKHRDAKPELAKATLPFGQYDAPA